MVFQLLAHGKVLLRDTLENFAQHLVGHTDVDTPGDIGKLHVHADNHYRFFQSDELNQRRVRLHAPKLEIQMQVVLPASAHEGNKLTDKVRVQAKVNVGIGVIRRQVVHVAGTAAEAVEHANHDVGRGADDNGRILALSVETEVGQRDNFPFQKRVREFMITLFVHRVNRHFTSRVDKGVDTGCENLCVVVKDAVEHLETFFCIFTRTAEIIFLEFFLLFLHRGKFVI